CASPLLYTLSLHDALPIWLCGILRFKVSRLRRSDGKEPVRQAEVLDVAEEVASSEEAAIDLTIQKEEQAIMWSALERVPETYRRSEEHTSELQSRGHLVCR